jgi:tetratricopeptide (TPR) repeat protein
MSTSPFIIELKNNLAADTYPGVLVALHQDPIIWASLEQTDLGRRALAEYTGSAGNTNPAHWTPAALSLLALNKPGLADQLKTIPDFRLDQELACQAAETRQAWLDGCLIEPDLAQCGLLALAWRELYPASPSEETSWIAEIRQDLHRHLPGAAVSLACLYGLLPENAGMGWNVLFSQVCHPIPGETSACLQCQVFALRAFLSNPLPVEDQVKALLPIFQSLDARSNLALLRKLSALRPHLAADLSSRQLESNYPVSPVCEEPVELSWDDIAAQCQDQIQQLTLAAEYHEMARQPAQAIKLVARSVRSARRLQGRLSAQLAYLMEQGKAHNGAPGDVPALQSNQEARLAAWRQAAQLDPDVPIYAAALGAALLEAGKTAEARPYLVNTAEILADENKQITPSLALMHAAGAQRTGDLKGALDAALKALDLLKQGASLSREGFYDLAAYFADHEQPDQAASVLEQALQYYPLDLKLLALSARLHSQVRCPQAALQDISLAFAQAAEERLPEEEYAKLQHVLHPALVSNLELIGAWQAALQERQWAMDNLPQGETPSPEEYRGLAACALQAGNVDTAMQACRQALLIDANDLQALHLSAQIARAMNDPAIAIDFLQRAVRIEPYDETLWIELAEAYQLNGQADQALEILRTASQALPGSANVHLALGEFYLQRESLTQALASLRTADRLQASARSAVRMGQALFGLGHFDQADQVLQRALAEGAEPEWKADLLAIEARTLMALERPKQAQPLFEQLLELTPGDLTSRVDYARALLKKPTENEARRAIEQLEIVLGQAPDVPLVVDALLELESQALLAEACALVGDQPRALKIYRQVFESQLLDRLANRSRLALGFGRVALQQGQPELALAVLKEALQNEPRSLDLHRLVAQAYLACGLLPDAFQAAQAALELSPSSLDNLTWFIDHGLRILAAPGGEHLPARQQVIRALDLATRLAPSRVDLLVCLVRMLVSNAADGSFDAALPTANSQALILQTLQRLADAGEELKSLKQEDLLFVGQTARNLGDASLAVSLLRQAYDQVQEPTVELCAELAQASYQTGDLTGALQVLEKAIVLDGQSAAPRIDLYLYQIDWYEQLGKPEQVLQSLNAALSLDAARPDLQLRAAALLRQHGDLNAGLLHAGQAVTFAQAAGDQTQLHQARLIAAELACLLLRPQEAWNWLHADLAGSDSACQHPSHLVLRAEMALDAGDLILGQECIDSLGQFAAYSALMLALKARQAKLSGDSLQAVEYFQQAMQGYEATLQSDEAESGDPDLLLLNLRGLTSAALDLHQWRQAQTLIDRWIKAAPAEPLAHFRHVQWMTQCAEDAYLCQELHLHRHSPGEWAILGDSQPAYEQAVRHLLELIDSQDAAAGGNQKTVASDMPEVAIWLSRGQVINHPNLRAAYTLGQAMKAHIARPDDVAALGMALRRIGEFAGARQALGTEWSTPIKLIDLAEHPAIIIQKALATPEQGVDTISQALPRALAAADFPGIPALHALQARLAHRNSDQSIALLAIQQALRIWPDEPCWHILASEILQAQEQPNLVQALHHLQQALALQGVCEEDCANSFRSLGTRFFQLGQPAQAVQALQQAAQLQPDQPQIWLALGKAQQAVGDLEQAANSVDHVVDIASDPTPAHLLRGEIALQSKNPRHALSRAQIVLHSQPDSLPALQLLGRAFEALDRPQDALPVLEKALSLDGADADLACDYLNLLRQAKGLPVAIPALEEMVDRYPERLELQSLRAQWLFQAGETDKAALVAQALLHSAPEALPANERAELHYHLGKTLHQSGQLDQAVFHLNEAVKLQPQHLESWLELGQVYQEERAHAQALKTYLQAVDLAPQDYRPYYQAGVALKDAKDYVKAEEMLLQAAQLAPEDLGVHRLLTAVMTLRLVHHRRS